MLSVGILGAGTWGIALARMLDLCGRQVTVWSALEEEIRRLSRTRRHPKLPGMEIPPGVCFTSEIARGELLAVIGFLDHLFDERRLASAEKARININFCHTGTPSSCIILLN